MGTPIRLHSYSFQDYLALEEVSTAIETLGCRIDGDGLYDEAGGPPGRG